MTDFNLRLNPDLDAQALRAQYAQNDYVRIHNIFPDDIAEAIYQVLARQTPWHLVHADEAGKHKYYRQEEWKALGGETQQRIFQNVYKKARSGFSYLYYVYPMINALLDGQDPDWRLHAMTEYLNTDEYRDFVKTITNEPSVIKLDAQATYYAPGHFLNTHNDAGEDAERRVAYVLGFSKHWRTDWGGQLLFLDSDNNISEGFTPCFNSLTMFKVPRTHVVSQIASFAGAPRFSITGWLRDDPKAH